MRRSHAVHTAASSSVKYNYSVYGQRDNVATSTFNGPSLYLTSNKRSPNFFIHLACHLLRYGYIRIYILADGQCTLLYVTHQCNIATSSMLQKLREVHGTEPSSSFPMVSTCATCMQQGVIYHCCHAAVAQPQWHCRSHQRQW